MNGTLQRPKISTPKLPAPPPRRRQKSSGILNLMFYLVLLATAGTILFIIGKAFFTVQETQPASASALGSSSYSPSQTGESDIHTTADASLWNLRLVNSSHPLPEGFDVKLTHLKNGQAVDSRIFEDLQAMMDDARKEGLSPVICSSFRSSEKQTRLFRQQVQKYTAQGYSKEAAQRKAGEWVAVPGTSEHQLGLAVDIVSASYQLLNEAQEKTAEQKWLMEHCAKYGFILRYPTDKNSITGIGYEPWHYRYVGKEAAKEIMNQGICLEEYLGLA